MNRNDDFPEFFPDGCPPDCSDFHFKEIKTYRMTNEEKNITKMSFKSYFEEKKPIKRPDKYLRDYAVSVFDDLQALNSIYEASFSMRKDYPSRLILVGSLKEQSGAILKFRAHISWWIKKDYNPSQEFKFLKGE